MTAAQPGEFELIDRYFRPLAGRAGLGLADDAALLPQEPNKEWVITTDMIVEGVHFLDDPPEAIAAKALRVNLSDLAAKGAAPFAYLLSLGLGDGWTEAWVAGFAAGLARDQGRYGIDLIGGDTTRSGERTTISITAIGRLPAGGMVTRDGARVGDIVVVSGTIGDAALGLRARKGELRPKAAGDLDHLLRRYLYPEPRVELAPALRRFAGAAMDVSDGLLGDLGKLCTASGVSAEINADQIPLSAAARAQLDRDPSLLPTVLNGGDDYEILCSLRQAEFADFAAEARSAGVPCTAIGRMTAGDEPPTVLAPDGKPVSIRGGSFDHFKATAPRR